MSDVMPYRSSRFSSLTDAQIQHYREAWCDHLGDVIEKTRPDVIHSHHIWIVSSLIKDVAPHIPLVTTCHATGLRQMELCPHLAESVRRGCRRLDRCLTLHHGHARLLHDELGIPSERIHVVGGGYREELFHDRARPESVGETLLYAGKYAHAKGLSSLLDAVERLAVRRPGLVLHVAGTGSGDEADSLHRRMSDMSPTVVLLGQIDQSRLAEFMRTSAVFVLPSFYEGLALVLVEAAASGCRLVATELPGVMEQLVPSIGDAVELVPMPPMQSIDVPDPAGLPEFVNRLEAAIDTALNRPRLPDVGRLVRDWTWNAVFERVETVWEELIEKRCREP
jgi:glycosyltransferase involved in cell wall biosynthesis